MNSILLASVLSSSRYRILVNEGIKTLTMDYDISNEFNESR